jgi:polyamine oxidase
MMWFDLIITDALTCIVFILIRLGVLQSDLVNFQPVFPEWKREALLSFHMTTYTKIFLKFEKQFWDDWQVRKIGEKFIFYLILNHLNLY